MYKINYKFELDLVVFCIVCLYSVIFIFFFFSFKHQNMQIFSPNTTIIWTEKKIISILYIENLQNGFVWLLYSFSATDTRQLNIIIDWLGFISFAISFYRNYFSFCSFRIKPIHPESESSEWIRQVQVREIDWLEITSKYLIKIICFLLFNFEH